MLFYAQQSLAPATRRLYAVGQRHYHTFCNKHQRRPLPATDMQLAEFVTFLVDHVKVAPIAINTYMVAVRSLHVEQGFGDSFPRTTQPHRVFTGVKRAHGTGPRLIRLPITRVETNCSLVISNSSSSNERIFEYFRILNRKDVAYPMLSNVQNPNMTRNKAQHTLTKKPVALSGKYSSYVSLTLFCLPDLKPARGCCSKFYST